MKNKKQKSESTDDIEIALEDVLGDSFEEPQIPEEKESNETNQTDIKSEEKGNPVIELPEKDKKVETAKNAVDLAGRMEMWNQSCKNIFMDLRSVTFTATDEEMLLECNDKAYLSKPLYFKADPQKPRDPKVLHAQKQFCKMIGIPHGFFSANRPQLKMNIVKTWQAGLGSDESKGRCIIRYRESPECCVIRAFVPETYNLIQNHELIKIINEVLISSGTVQDMLDFAYGDERDDLVLHARYLFGEKFKIFDSNVCVGFSVIASELGANPIVVEALLYQCDSRTGYIASYGAEPFFKAKYEGIQPQDIKDLFPKLIKRITDESLEMKGRIEYFKEEIDPKEECLVLNSFKGIPSKAKRALFHEASSCSEDMKTKWDFARHISLIAKDFDSLKRLRIERASGEYLNLMFNKQ